MTQIKVITGPTAAGKTVLALRMAGEHPDFEIVNADATLLYKGFDIGAAKPSQEIRKQIPHHIIDVLNPDERFNAADFSVLARNVIRGILNRGKTPIVVGGTGFYIDALFFGITSLEADREKLEQARIRVAKEMHESGFQSMLEKLQRIDSALYMQISRERNPRRLERAWEYYYATGIPLGEARSEPPQPFEHEPSFTVIEIEKEELRARITERIDRMLNEGWLKEVESLLAGGMTPGMPAMNAIGYRELAAVLLEEKPCDQAREEIIIRTRQYAKRQVTWMKRYKKQ